MTNPREETDQIKCRLMQCVSAWDWVLACVCVCACLCTAASAAGGRRRRMCLCNYQEESV